MGDDELRRLLNVAAGPVSVIDPTADLARGRAARQQQFRRRIQAGTATLALLAVAGVGIGIAVTNDSPSNPSISAHAGYVQLVDAPFDATPYTFDLTPKGWSVQGQDEDHVTIVPDSGNTSDDPNDFIGKLVIMYDQNQPDGERVYKDGRAFWIRGGEGYVTIATLTRPGEPAGEVLIQYPDGTGWTRETMVRFLGSVHIGAGAQPGLG
jgi:hypothetical protein